MVTERSHRLIKENIQFIQMTYSQKPLCQLKPNYISNILGTTYWQLACRMAAITTTITFKQLLRNTRLFVVAESILETSRVPGPFPAGQEKNIINLFIFFFFNFCYAMDLKDSSAAGLENKLFIDPWLE